MMRHAEVRLINRSSLSFFEQLDDCCVHFGESEEDAVAQTTKQESKIRRAHYRNKYLGLLNLSRQPIDHRHDVARVVDE